MVEFEHYLSFAYCIQKGCIHNLFSREYWLLDMLGHYLAWFSSKNFSLHFSFSLLSENDIFQVLAVSLVSHLIQLSQLFYINFYFHYLRGKISVWVIQEQKNESQFCAHLHIRANLKSKKKERKLRDLLFNEDFPVFQIELKVYWAKINRKQQNLPKLSSEEFKALQKLG